MKLIASVAALVLTGLVAGWLWLDATADVRSDTAGVAITGAVDPADMSGAALTVDGAAAEEDETTTGTSTDVTGASGTAAGTSGTAAGTSGTAAGTSATVEAAEEGLAAGVASVLGASAGELVDRAEETRAADRKAKAEKKAKERSRAVEVQPAPVNPGGWCEWDDDDGWECDDYDDDDWDDDWDDD